MPRPLRLALFCLALLAVVLGVLVAATALIPPRAHAWIALALSIVIALREAIPVLWARLVTAPDVEPVRVVDAVKPAVFLLAFLEPAAALAVPVPGVALAPGPLEIAAEAVRPQQPPIPRQPMVYAADLAPLQVSPALLTLLAPDAPAVPVVTSDATPAPTHAGEVAAVVRSAAAAVEAAKAAPVPPGFWQSKTGQALGVTLNVATVVTSAALAFASVYAAVR